MCTDVDKACDMNQSLHLSADKHFKIWLSSSPKPPLSRAEKGLSSKDTYSSLTTSQPSAWEIKMLRLFSILSPQLQTYVAGKCEGPRIFQASCGKRVGSMPMYGLMPDSVINSQKDSLVYLAKGQTAYGPCHLVHPLTTLASIYKVRTFSSELHAKKSQQIIWSQEKKIYYSPKLKIHKKV